MARLRKRSAQQRNESAQPHKQPEHVRKQPERLRERLEHLSRDMAPPHESVDRVYVWTDRRAERAAQSDADAPLDSGTISAVAVAVIAVAASRCSARRPCRCRQTRSTVQTA